MSETEKARTGRGCSLLGCFGVAFLVLLVVATVSYFVGVRGGTEQSSVLVLELDPGFPERSPPPVLGLWRDGSLDVLGLCRALERAAADVDVPGILVRVSSPQLAPGKAEEIRDALLRFRESGKWVVAHADGPDTLGYYLATAADDVLLDRSAPLQATGIHLQAYFVADVLDRLGIAADFVRVGRYKGTYEQLTANAPSPAFDEAMGSIADSLFDTIVASIAEARKLSAEDVEAFLDSAPILPDRALDEGLVDRLVFGDEVREAIGARGTAEPAFRDMGDYAAAGRAEGSGNRAFAIVHASGMMVDGLSRRTVVGGPVCGAATVTRALREAAEDREIVGILLRIDSPGGSVSAAEKIWHAVGLASQQKPVVASLGPTAASGGYYIAAAADRVLARAMTLTGSIGIFGGKVVVEKLLAEHGIRRTTYSRGARAGMFDITQRFSESERLALEELLADSYRRFVHRVAQGRDLTFEEVDATAQGRVWSGEQAVERRLVDAIGGIDEAVDELRKLARLSPDTVVDVRPFPRSPSWWDLFADTSAAPFVRSDPRAHPVGASELLDLVREETRAWLLELGLFDGSGLALMPFVLAGQ